MKEVLRSVRCKGYAIVNGVRTPEFVRFIHAVNQAALNAGEEEIFGEPIEMGSWWAGGDFEAYPEARVIIRNDGSESVQAFTERAARHFDSAAATLGWKVSTTR